MNVHCPQHMVPAPRRGSLLPRLPRHRPSSHAPPTSCSHGQGSRPSGGRLLVRAQQQQQQQTEVKAQTDGIYSYSDPFQRLLGRFLPPATDAEAELAHVQWDAPKVGAGGRGAQG